MGLSHYEPTILLERSAALHICKGLSTREAGRGHATPHMPVSLAVEGFDPEEIGIEVILVPKEANFFVEQHIQNPPKSALGKSH